MKTLSSLARARYRTGLLLFCLFLSMAVSNLCSRRNGHLRPQSRCRSTRTARMWYLQVRRRVHWQSMAMASYTVLFPLALPLLLPFPLLGAQTRLLPSRLPALMMAFFPLLTSPPVFLLLDPSGARVLSPRAWVCLNRLLLHPFLVCHPRPLGCIPFPFLPSPLPSFLHLLLISLLSSRLFLSFIPPPIPACASCVTSLSSSSPSSSRTVLCHVLS